MNTITSARNLLLALLAFVMRAGTQNIPAADADIDSLHGYFIGNSVTDTVRYGSLAKLAASRGRQLVWGRQIIPSAPIHQLYKDGIHLNETGSYLVGCAFFATLFREDSTGLPTEPYGVIAPAVAKAIHETVWKTVREHPESGVK
jgi:hypothetical protein